MEWLTKDEKNVFVGTVEHFFFLSVCYLCPFLRPEKLDDGEIDGFVKHFLSFVVFNVYAEDSEKTSC